MTKAEVLRAIEETGVIAAVREHSMEDALYAGDTVARGGVFVVEIALTLPNANSVIAKLTKTTPGIVAGAGSVVDAAAARESLDAGAKFLTSDAFHPDVIEFAAKHGVVVIPGALTPTEVVSAWRDHADFVKVVPCAQMGGAPYIASLHAMFPKIPLVASGGVDQRSASKLILSGAVALGIGRELIPEEAVQQRQTDRIGELARRFLDFVKTAKERLAVHAKRTAAQRETQS